MKNLLTGKLLYAISVIIALNISISAYSQNKRGKTQQAGAVKLEYQYLNETPVKYITTSKITQVMDIQGQAMENNINSLFCCSVKAVGKNDSGLKLEIRIDTLSQVVESPMGTSGGSVGDVQGKVFNIVISPDGKTTDVSEAEKIIYNVEGGGEAVISQTFLDFFPVLPGNPVKIGDTWNLVDTVAGKTSTTFSTTSVNSVDMLEAIENIDGVECARISSTLSGTMTMKIQNQGMDITMGGAYTGTATVLFAIKEGYFIRQTSASKVTGNIEISAPEIMTFPLVMDVNSVKEIKK